MVGAEGFETLPKPKNPPQNPQNFPIGAQIGAQSIVPDSDLAELSRLWPNLSPEIKRLLLLMAREGGKRS